MNAYVFGGGARLPRASSAAELTAFEQLCERLVGFDDVVSPEWADGWLAALACAPLRPSADAWLGAMLGDAFERAFADPPDRAQALAVLEARLRVLRDQLDAEAIVDRPDELRLDPLMYEWSDEDRRSAVAEGDLTQDEAQGLHTGMVWAEGVLDGIEAWAALGAQLDALEDEARSAFTALFERVQALVLHPHGKDWEAFRAAYHAAREPTRDDLVADALYALQDLRLWWLDHAPRPETRRVAARPGRNDPCPCGSGRKYKKCHGGAGDGA